MDYKTLDEAAEAVKEAFPGAKPACGLILGSGWGEVADAFKARGTLAYQGIPGMGTPGVAGHAGRLVWCSHAGLETFVFQGRRHWYEGEGWTPIALPIYLLKKLGARILLVTNAAGGIRKDLGPGSLMLIEDHINHMGAHPLIGPAREIWGPRFLDQTAAYDRALRTLLVRAADATNIDLRHGTYLATTGPTYETPAEIRAFAALGADAVGMSTVPETMLANAAGLRVLGLSCITNWAAGILAQPLTHEEVTATTKKAMPKMKSLLLQLWEEIAHAR